MELLVTCDCCNGSGIEEKTFYNSENRTRTIEKNKCSKCQGKGFLIKKRHYLTYELIIAKRKIDYYWKLLKHECNLPSYYFYDTSEECSSCGGHGYIEEKTYFENKTIIKEHECKFCNGNGVINTKTTKDIYSEIFNDYLENKKIKDEIIKILHNKDWEDKIYYQFAEFHPYGYSEVCIRCKTYFEAMDSSNSCCGCTNESMCPENGCYFEPYNEKYRQWFIDKGYKKCIGYSNKYKNWKDI